MGAPFVLEERGSATVIRLLHGKANLLDLEFLLACERLLAELAAAPPRAYVLTGTGGIFSAGVDLLRLLQGGQTYLDEFLPALSRVLRALYAFPRPLIAAINGHAIAGGCLVALCAEHRVMAAGPGRMGVPELRVGVAFPAAALEILRAAVPAPHFETVVLGGGVYEPAEARRLGLVHEVADDALAAALQAAQERAAIQPGAYALSKRHARAATLEAIDRGEAETRAGIAALWAAGDTRRAIQGYVERTLRKG